MFVLIRLAPRTTLLPEEILPSKALLAVIVVMFWSRRMPLRISLCPAPGVAMLSRQHGTGCTSQMPSATSTALLVSSIRARGSGTAHLRLPGLLVQFIGALGLDARVATFRETCLTLNPKVSLATFGSEVVKDIVSNKVPTQVLSSASELATVASRA